MNTIIFLGPPGVGKGTQAKMLADHLKYLHLSTGNLLREEAKSGSQLGNKVKDIMQKGELVSDSLISEIVDNFINQHKNERGIILDGYPRTLTQAEHLKKTLSSLSLPDSMIISLTADNEELIKRLVKRAKTEGRADDTEEVIKNRLVVYDRETKPLIDFYSNNSSYYEVNGMGSVEEIFNNIKNLF